MLVDDLGYFDSSVYNENSVTPVLRSLADDGVRLSRMYTYKYCSPTRRALLRCYGQHCTEGMGWPPRD